MCVALVGKVCAVDVPRGEAIVDVDGRQRHVSVAPLVLTGVLVAPGDDVLLHTGVAIAVLDEESAVAMRSFREEAT
jgi:hydrogenase assembly chaperone HypC/HupF